MITFLGGNMSNMYTCTDNTINEARDMKFKTNIKTFPRAKKLVLTCYRNFLSTIELNKRYAIIIILFHSFK